MYVHVEDCVEADDDLHDIADKQKKKKALKTGSRK